MVASPYFQKQIHLHIKSIALSIRTIIVEDERASQELLSTIVSEYCPYLQLVGVAESVEVAYSLIQNNQPDLIFLDIHIGQETGFDLLDSLEEKDFKIIITTAHEEYALKAFKYEAVDYILKPYTPKDVIKSVERIKEKMDESKAFQKLEKSIKNSQYNRDFEKLTISTSDGLRVFKIEHLTRIEGSGAYCKIFSLESKPLLISKTLKEIEKLLPPSQFFRPHDSHIINMRHVKEFKKGDGGVVILENGEQIPVSRRRKQEFLDLLMEL